MITSSMRLGLKGLGFSDEEIDRMTSAQAWERLQEEPPVLQALACAGRGWSVFPCRVDKRPYTKHGFHDACTGLGQIQAWWEQWPEALVGIACQRSGFFAVDIDHKNGVDGLRSWDVLVDTCGGGQAVVVGPVQRTPGGGLHLLFQYPDGLEIPNNANQLGPGLDLRSAGYICSGRGYAWLPGHDPDLPLTPAPGWLLERIRELSGPKQQPAPTGKSSGGDHSRENPGAYWLKKAIDRASPGNRNDTGFWLAAQLRDAGLSEEEAEGVLVDYARSAPGEGYTEKEARHSLKQAYKEPPRRPARIPRGIAAGTGDLAPAEDPPPFPTGPAGDELADTLLTQSCDHEGHARCVRALYPDRIAYCQAYGWMYFNEKYWQRENAAASVDRAIVETLKARRLQAVRAENEALFKVTRATSGNLTGTRLLLQSLAPVSVSVFDQEPDHLNCRNGVVDLRTGELSPHDPRQRFTYVLPVDYDPQAGMSRWMDFLKEAVGPDPEYLGYLKRAVGYSLTGYTWEEVLFYLYGPTRSGKGTFTETLLRTFGQPLAVEADFSTFTALRSGDNQNFDLAPLKPCRFVAASESHKAQPLNPARIKALTGGNDIHCAFKHHDHFSYRPQFKIWLSSNHPANVDVDDDAAWARVRVISFPNSHLGREDKGLKAELRRAESLQGVLRWAVEGAREWYRAGKNGLETPAAVQQATQSQRAAQDFIQQFLDEMTEKDPDHWAPSGALHQAYKTWCEANGVPWKYQNQFSQALASKGYILTRIKDRNEGNRWKRAIKGLRLRDRYTAATLRDIPF